MRLHILVVEGSLTARMDAHAALGGTDATVATAASIAEGRLLLSSRHFELVILDAALLDGAGKALLESCQQARIPALLTVPLQGQALLAASLAAGASAVIKRPFTSAQLVAKVEEVLRIAAPPSVERVRPVLVRGPANPASGGGAPVPMSQTSAPVPPRKASVGPLFDQVVAQSGLSALLARSALERLCLRNNVVPSQLTPVQLSRLMPELSATVRLFLKQGADERIRALEVLAGAFARRTPPSLPALPKGTIAAAAAAQPPRPPGDAQRR